MTTRKSKWKTGDRFRLRYDYDWPGDKFSAKKGEIGKLTRVSYGPTPATTVAFAVFDKAPSHYPVAITMKAIEKARAKSNPRPDLKKAQRTGLEMLGISVAKQRRHRELVALTGAYARGASDLSAAEYNALVIEKRELEGEYPELTGTYWTGKKNPRGRGKTRRERADSLMRQLDKARPRRSRKKNPAPAFVIALYMGTANKRLTYDATRNRFTDNSKPSLYATQIAAKNRAEVLLQNNKMLIAYRVTVEPATDAEKGGVYGARPRVNNPDDRYKVAYTYVSPGRAGPFRGKDELNWKPTKGDEIRAPFGLAIVKSVSKVRPKT